MKKQLIVAKIGDKEYKFGLPNATSIEKLEEIGFNIDEMGKTPLKQTINLFYGGLLYAYPEMKREEAVNLFNEIMEDENSDISQITKFLMQQFTDFFQAQTGSKKNAEKYPIINI